MINQLTLPDFALQANPKWSNFNSKVDLKGDHVFKIDVQAYYSAIDWQNNDTLTETEIAKSKRFHQNVDSMRFLVTRHAIRSLTALFIKTDPASVVFKFNDNGKPFVDGISFNISHSGNYVLIAASGYSLGIDIELMSKKFDFENVIEFCFNDPESEKIKTAHNSREMFYTLWTRKEAILKATGEGLVDDLLTINCLKKLHTRLNHNYKVISWKLDHDYVFSLATTKINTDFKFWNYTPQK